MSEEGSVSEASKICTSQRLPGVRAFKLRHYTSAENHFTAWLHPTLLPRTLAKTCLNPHLLPTLLSAPLAAPTHAQRRGMLLLRSGALLLHLVWHMLICKERRRTLHHQSQSIVPTDHATEVYGFYTLLCVQPSLIIRLS